MNDVLHWIKATVVGYRILVSLVLLPIDPIRRVAKLSVKPVKCCFEGLPIRGRNHSLPLLPRLSEPASVTQGLQHKKNQTRGAIRSASWSGGEIDGDRASRARWYLHRGKTDHSGSGRGGG